MIARRDRTGAGGLNVVLVTGICVPYDAISNAVVDRARIFRRLPEVDRVTVFTQFCERDLDADEVVTLGDAWSLLRHPAVREADLIVFHWGIAYELFAAMTLLGDDPRAVVQFHNVTPIELVDVDGSDQMQRSFRQIQLVPTSSCRIWADSEFNRDTLVEWGVAPDRIRVLPFPIEAPRRIEAHDAGDPVRLLTVGRLVRAKGVDVLIEAVRRLVADRGPVVDLTLAGNLELSDRQLVDDLRETAEESGLRELVTFEDGPTDDELWDLFERSDVVVSPSLHEGLCVPIVQGYIAGCRAVGTDAGNLPNVVVAPDPTVEASDAGALAEALGWIVDEIRAGRSAPPAAAGALVRRHASPAIERALRDELSTIVPDRTPAGAARRG